jgi:proline-rich protein PRCC
MLLANYASDSDSDHEDAGPSRPAPVAATTVKPKRKAPVKITLDLPKSSTDSTTVDNEDEERGSKKAKTGTGPKGGKGSYVSSKKL